MPADARIEETTKDDGTTIERLHIEFTNGSLKQLRELGTFFKVENEDPSEVVQLAISFLQNIKDKKEGGTQDSPSRKE